MSTQYLFDEYAFRVEPLAAAEGGGYSISFPDLPGCLSDGETIEEVLKNGEGAFEAWRDTRLAEAKAMPAPGSYGDAQATRFVQRLPRYVHERLVEASNQQGVSVNTLVTTLVAEGLVRYELGFSAALPSGVGGFGAGAGAMSVRDAGPAARGTAINRVKAIPTRKKKASRSR